METYLVIITTVLVLTQVIRVTQNAIQLKQVKKTDAENQKIIQANKEVEIENKKVLQHMHRVLDKVENYIDYSAKK